MSSSHRSSRRTPAAVLLALFLALALLGCSAGGSDSSGPDAGGGGAEGAAEGSAGDESSPQDGGGDAVVGNAGRADVVVDEPRRIRRGSVAVEVEDLPKAAGQVRDLTASLQGYVSDESIGLTSAPETFADEVGEQEGAPARPSGPGEARLVIRVPEVSMQEAMDAIAGLGAERSRWSTETEVEAALVDLESRVATQTASVERVRALLDQATSLSDVVLLESELSERESELESITAQQQALAGRAAMATVTAVLNTPDAAVGAQDEDGFLAGLAAGWDALEASTVVLLTLVGVLLPFALLAVLVVVPLLVWRRRVRRDRSVPVPAGTT